MTGEAAVTLGATDQGLVSGDLVNTASRLQGVAASGTVLIDEATHRATAVGASPPRPSASRTSAADESRSRPGGRSSVWRWSAAAAERSARAAVRRSGRRAAPAQGPPPRGRRRVAGPARVGHRDRRDRQEPARLGAREVHRRDRQRRLLAPGPVAGLRRGRRLLGARRDGPQPGRDRRDRRRRGEPGQARRRRSRRTCPTRPSGGRWCPGCWPSSGSGGRGEIDRDEAFAAARRLIERIAERGLAVFVFEDLQWADDGLIDFIESVLEWSRNHRILIVTLARPELLERRPTWGAGQRNFTALHLEPLADAAMTQLLDGVAAGSARGPFVRRIVERAAGIPLFAVETIRMLIDDGRLVRDGDDFRLEGEVGELAVPESLRGLIGARIDGLTPADRALAPGRRRARPELHRRRPGRAHRPIASRPSSHASGASSGGRSWPSIDDPGSPERGQYTFVQGLIREVAYETLAQEGSTGAPPRRRALLRDARQRRAGRDPGEPLPRRLSGDAGRSRGRCARRPGPDRPPRRGRAGRGARARTASALDYLEKALTVTTDPAERARALGGGGDRGVPAGPVRRQRALRAARARLAHRAAGDETGIARAAVLIVQPFFDDGQDERGDGRSRGGPGGLPERSGRGRGRDPPSPSSPGSSWSGQRSPRRSRWWSGALIEAERLRLDPTIADALVTKAAFLDTDGRNARGSRPRPRGDRPGRRARAGQHRVPCPGEPAPASSGRTTLVPRSDWRPRSRERARSLGLREQFRWPSWMCVGLDMSLGAFDGATRARRRGRGGRPGRVRPRRGPRHPSGHRGLPRRRPRRRPVSGGRGGRLPGGVAAGLPRRALPREGADPGPCWATCPGALDEAMAGARIDAASSLPALAMRVRHLVRRREGARRARGYVVGRRASAGGTWMPSAQPGRRAGCPRGSPRRKPSRAIRDGCPALRDLDSTLELGLSQLDYASLLGPADPVARAAADEARAIFERIDSPPLLERLRLGLERWERRRGRRLRQPLRTAPSRPRGSTDD